MKYQDRIKYIRGDLTQKEFAKKIGVHFGTVRFFEQGHIPKGEMLLTLRRELNVNIDWLLTGNGEPYIKDGFQTENSGSTGRPTWTLARIRSTAVPWTAAPTRSAWPCKSMHI